MSKAGWGRLHALLLFLLLPSLLALLSTPKRTQIFGYAVIWAIPVLVYLKASLLLLAGWLVATEHDQPWEQKLSSALSASVMVGLIVTLALLSIVLQLPRGHIPEYLCQGGHWCLQLEQARDFQHLALQLKEALRALAAVPLLWVLVSWGYRQRNLSFLPIRVVLWAVPLFFAGLLLAFGYCQIRLQNPAGQALTRPALENEGYIREGITKKAKPAQQLFACILWANTLQASYEGELIAKEKLSPAEHQQLKKLCEGLCAAQAKRGSYNPGMFEDSCRHISTAL